MTKPFMATLEGPLASKKNGKVIRISRSGRILGLMENAKVRAVENRLIEQLYLSAAQENRYQGRDAVFPDESLELTVVIDKDLDTTHVTIQKIADKPKGKTGRRRDIQNEIIVVCDALERAKIVNNDNQFARINIIRRINGKVE